MSANPRKGWAFQGVGLGRVYSYFLSVLMYYPNVLLKKYRLNSEENKISITHTGTYCSEHHILSIIEQNNTIHYLFQAISGYLTSVKC